jgi:uncharacterized protein YceK
MWFIVQMFIATSVMAGCTSVTALSTLTATGTDSLRAGGVRVQI